jgi:hypothetical protein
VKNGHLLIRLTADFAAKLHVMHDTQLKKAFGVGIFIVSMTGERIPSQSPIFAPFLLMHKFPRLALFLYQKKYIRDDRMCFVVSVSR